MGYGSAHGGRPSRTRLSLRDLHLDHEPAHVHVTGAGQAKINLLGPGGRPELVYSVDISRADMRRLMEEAAEHQTHFLAEWERIHGAG